MSPKKLIIALWAVVVAVALAIVFTPSSEDYREYASTQVVPAAKVVAPAPVAAPVAPAEAAKDSVASASPVAAPGISLNGVSALLSAAGPAPVATSEVRQAQAPQAPVATPVAATETSQVKPVEGLPASWRTAATVSPAEVDTYVRQEAMTTEDAAVFRSACNHDHSLKFDGKGQALYACAMKFQVGPDTTPITSVPSYPLAETFRLHSRPTASRKIYLDFDGHTTSGTPWNAAWRGGADFTTPPFSRDSNPEFSDAERAIVQEAFRRVAEHFAPWNVDVTTEDPGVEALRKTSAGDMNYGIRVVIGPDVNATGAGGIAYLHSFDDPIDNPCFTFTGTGSNAAYIAGVTSHEVGHTVSLVHQGQNPGTGEYFSGHGTGALSWSPIMGNGLRPVNQWAKGEYQNATSTQDNLDAIANPASGIPLAADDHGNTRDTATFAPGLSATVGGIISSPTDVDIIRINAGRGNLVITPRVSLFAPNLRLQVRVLDSAGTVLGTYVGTGAAGNMAPRPITVAIPTEGMHFIELDGIGNGTGVTEGYTDYGSIGFYSFTATWADPVNRPPVANATLSTNLSYNYQTQQAAVVNFNGTLSSDPDGIILRYIWDFKDVYPAGATGATATHRYKAPGTYYPTLTVVDDRGASASTTVTVTVTGPNRPATCSLALIQGSFVRMNSINDAATATIRVQDQFGNPVRRALVYVSTSGLVAMRNTAIRTDDLGQVVVNTPGFRRGARGSVVFSVSRVEAPGRPYVTTTAMPVVTVAPTVTITR
jgi:PKD repeat protein